eukprot:14752145-Ditylum_brightwellii.AAC.1
MTSTLAPKVGPSKTNGPKCGSDKHFTNQCTLEDKYLVSPDADCSPSFWKHHILGDEHNKFVEHHKTKKATMSQLAATESNTVAGIA